jgi:NosR/NirI family nitrous oxide reductase transcriptional regulator
VTKRLDRIAGVVAFATIVTAWIIGAPRQRTDVGSFLRQVLPRASEFTQIRDGVYEGRTGADAGSSIAGYVTVARTDGYGGPMQVAVGIDPSGNIAGAAVMDHNETPAFFDRINPADYLKGLVGKSHADSFTPGDDIDAVSGATVSLDTLATSVRRGSRRLAADALGLPVEASEARPVRFALPEALVIVLFALGFLTHSRPLRGRPTLRHALRWGTRLAGLLFLGFLFTIPVSIINVHSLLAGYRPDWQANIYWYLLVVGAFLPLALTDKRVYCDSLCPFGAAQDVLKLVGGAKLRLKRRYRTALRWMQRTLAWAAIIVALLYRNPGRFDYEVFGTFFALSGTVFQFALLGVVLVASLFLLRPWCNILCPLRAVTDYIRMLRRWVKEILASASPGDGD